jgi:hypothetical protein
MKTVSLEELDEPMKSLIRNAASEPTVVVDQGVVIAEIRVPEIRKEGRRIPLSHWDSIPLVRVNVDSTDIISEDRDR